MVGRFGCVRVVQGRKGRQTVLGDTSFRHLILRVVGSRSNDLEGDPWKGIAVAG